MIRFTVQTGIARLPAVAARRRSRAVFARYCATLKHVLESSWPTT